MFVCVVIILESYIDVLEDMYILKRSSVFVSGCTWWVTPTRGVVLERSGDEMVIYFWWSSVYL